MIDLKKFKLWVKNTPKNIPHLSTNMDSDEFIELIQALEQAKEIIEFFSQYKLHDRMKLDGRKYVLTGHDENAHVNNPAQEWLAKYFGDDK